MVAVITCDACVQRAVNEILLAGGGSLHFCQHHTDKYALKLVEMHAIISSLEVSK